MANFATTADVEAAWRALTAAESTVAGTKLTFASAIIRRNIPDIDDRIVASPTPDELKGGMLDVELVKAITVEMVLRHLRNPEGWRQESIEDFTRTRDSALSAGGIYLSNDEFALLTAVPVRRAFTIPTEIPTTSPALGGTHSTWAAWQS